MKLKARSASILVVLFLAVFAAVLCDAEPPPGRAEGHSASAQENAKSRISATAKDGAAAGTVPADPFNQHADKALLAMKDSAAAPRISTLNPGSRK
jgi:hypothetical protein